MGASKLEEAQGLIARRIAELERERHHVVRALERLERIDGQPTGRLEPGGGPGGSRRGGENRPRGRVQGGSRSPGPH